MADMRDFYESARQIMTADRFVDRPIFTQQWLKENLPVMTPARKALVDAAEHFSTVYKAARVAAAATQKLVKDRRNAEKHERELFNQLWHAEQAMLEAAKGLTPDES